MVPPLFTRRFLANLSSRFKTKNRRVQRFGCADGIEIFAQERDLVACRTQEQHIVLEVDTPRRFDKPFCLDFGDCRVRIAEGMHLEFVEAKNSLPPSGVDHSEGLTQGSCNYQTRGINRYRTFSV